MNDINDLTFDEYKIKPGDVVRHRPSNERWVVSMVDYERNELSWFGWPEGYARLSDCELVTSVTFEQALKAVVEWAEPKRNSDMRQRWAASVLRVAGLKLTEATPA